MLTYEKLFITGTSTKRFFTIKNSFQFSKEICEKTSKYIMASLDIESLFTNIPSEETIKFCCDSLYKNQEFLSNINKNQSEKLLKTCILQRLHFV